MRKSGFCPKCGSADLVVVEPGLYNSFPAGMFAAARLERYVCLDCGFSEEWVEEAALEKVRKFYGTSVSGDAEETT